MKIPRSGLFMVALVFLMCTFAPYLACAQDDGPVPWPCNALDPDSRTSPYPCHLVTQDEDIASQSYDPLVQGVGFAPNLSNTLDRGTPSTESDILDQYALLEDRRQGFAVIRG